MRVKLSELRDLANKILARFGYSGEEAAIIAEVLFYAQLRGSNQGLVKLIGNGIPERASVGEIKVVKETKLSALLDGNHNQSMVVLKKAVDKAVSKAGEHGFGMVGTNNTAKSTGALGYFANEIAKRGFIGWVFAGSPETVNTHGSYEPIFGTNPLAIGVPTEDDPLVLDMATSAMAYFGLIEAKTAGNAIPDGIAYDIEGNLTTDPAKAMDGAIRPFDRSYKGAGLSMMVEILTGPLVGASFTGIGDTAGNWGNLAIAMDPEMLVDRDQFKKQVSEMIRKVKGTKKLPGVGEILVPGERGNKLTRERVEAGEMEIEDNLYKELKKKAEKFEND